MTKVLFICHGNICRSPMAEFIFKAMLCKYGMENIFTVASAATSTEEIVHGVGNPVYPPAREELAKHGISCDGKRAVQIKIEDYEKYDYLIAMDNYNIQNIKRIIGIDTENKVFKLLEFAGESGDIADPWYTGNFDRTYEDIVRGCKGVLKYVKEEWKTKLLEAIEIGETELAKEYLWNLIAASQYHQFKTMSGLPFTYSIKRGKNGELTKELWIDRRENSKSLSWSSILIAFSSALKMKVADRPKALGDIRGISYIYPMLWHFGVISVPDRVTEKMK